MFAKTFPHKTKEHWRTHREQHEGILLRTSMNILGDKVPHLINSSSTLPQKGRGKKKGLVQFIQAHLIRRLEIIFSYFSPQLFWVGSLAHGANSSHLGLKSHLNE
jgi:hypothetical protein